jgi:hypothetical protein
MMKLRIFGTFIAGLTGAMVATSLKSEEAVRILDLSLSPVMLGFLMATIVYMCNELLIFVMKNKQ